MLGRVMLWTAAAFLAVDGKAQGLEIETAYSYPPDAYEAQIAGRKIDYGIQLNLARFLAVIQPADAASLAAVLTAGASEGGAKLEFSADLAGAALALSSLSRQAILASFPGWFVDTELRLERNKSSIVARWDSEGALLWRESHGAEGQGREVNGTVESAAWDWSVELSPTLCSQLATVFQNAVGGGYRSAIQASIFSTGPNPTRLRAGRVGRASSVDEFGVPVELLTSAVGSGSGRKN